jgi:hypothetical protein
MNLSRLCLVLILAALAFRPALGQELTPRAYWPLPTGTNVMVLSYQRNSGDILIDPSLPITGVTSKIDYFQAAYQRAFDFLGRTATAQLSVPYADGQSSGIVDGEFRVRRVSGFTDARLRLAVNLAGAPAMDAAGMRALRSNPRTIVGASLLIQGPSGEYDEDRLFNLGTNRWSIKPAVGMIIPVAPTWLFEAEVGAWFFGDNDDFLGQTRQQDAIVSAEMHLIKRFRPGFWASLDANYYFGGETRVGDQFRDDLQRNSRAGVTFVVPVQGRHAVRGSYSTGVTTESGGDFELFSLSYLYAW